MYSRPQDPLWKSALLLIRSVKSNKALLLEEVTRALLLEEVTRAATEKQVIHHLRKEETYDGQDYIFCQRQR